MHLKILDCTIRDGGYINDWKFSREFGRHLYRSLSESGVDYAEIGFFEPRSQHPEIWTHCDEALIAELRQSWPGGAKIALMINYGSVELAEVPPRSAGTADMIRIACAKGQALEALKMGEAIRAMGYETCVNLMGISHYQEQELAELRDLLAKYGAGVDHVYMADSFGCLNPARTAELVRFLPGDNLGFHAHNNLQLAFANCLAAMDAGISIIDGSILGMGRGAGNLYLEAALAHLETLAPERFTLLPVLRFAEMFVEPMKREYSWGYSLAQMLSGVIGCHPNYPTNLLKMKNFTADDVYHILRKLPEDRRSRFSTGSLQQALREHEAERGASVQAGPLRQRLERLVTSHQGGVLLLCGGPSVGREVQMLKARAESEGLLIVAVNHPPQNWDLDLVCYGNGRRLWQYASASPEVPVVYAQGLTLPAPRENALELDYRTVLKLPAEMRFSNSGVIATLMLGVLGARRIHIAGMDGFGGGESGDFYYRELDHVLEESLRKDLNDQAKRELDAGRSVLAANGIQAGIVTATSYQRHRWQE